MYKILDIKYNPFTQEYVSFTIAVGIWNQPCDYVAELLVKDKGMIVYVFKRLSCAQYIWIEVATKQIPKVYL